jgi:hypothetical protein
LITIKKDIVDDSNYFKSKLEKFRLKNQFNFDTKQKVEE